MFLEPHEPTQQLRDAVSLHAAIGTPQETIGRILGIDAKTLRKYYRDELDLGSGRANAAVAGKLYQKAMNGDTVSQIFWLKTRAGWRDVHRHEFSGPGGGPVTLDVGKLSTSALEQILTARKDT